MDSDAENVPERGDNPQVEAITDLMSELMTACLYKRTPVVAQALIGTLLSVAAAAPEERPFIAKQMQFALNMIDEMGAADVDKESAVQRAEEATRQLLKVLRMRPPGPRH